MEIIRSDLVEGSIQTLNYYTLPNIRTKMVALGTIVGIVKGRNCFPIQFRVIFSPLFKVIDLGPTLRIQLCKSTRKIKI